MNEFCIPIRVEDEEALYDAFYPSGRSFSGDLVVYLEDYIVDHKLGENIGIELQSSTGLDMERFRATYQTYVEKLIRRNKREIRRSDLKAGAALLLGAIFVIIGYSTADQVHTVTAEIISAVGSFSMWAAIALFIETLPTLRYKDRILKLFSEAEIRFRNTGAEEQR